MKIRKKELRDGGMVDSEMEEMVDSKMEEIMEVELTCKGLPAPASWYRVVWVSL